MSQEILYTSAPKLLKLGLSGYGTVVSTQGMPQPLADRLEQLSGYRWAFDLGDPRGDDNPVNHSHVTIIVAGQRYHVLSRISNYPADYSGRSNKIAHHVALLESELPPGGPAWVLMSPGFCEAQWDGHLKTISAGRKPTFTTRSTADYSLWKQLTGDAGWAGVLAEMALQEDRRPIQIIFPLGTNTLALVEQALNLLPHRERWKVTFSTYYTGLPASVECLWQFVLDETPEATQLRRNPHQRVIDLASTLGPATGGPLVEEARSGRQPPLKSTPPEAPSPNVREAAALLPPRQRAPAIKPSEHAPPPLPVQNDHAGIASVSQPTQPRITLAAALLIGITFGIATGVSGYYLGRYSNREPLATTNAKELNQRFGATPEGPESTKATIEKRRTEDRSFADAMTSPNQKQMSQPPLEHPVEDESRKDGKAPLSPTPAQGVGNNRGGGSPSGRKVMQGPENVGTSVNALPPRNPVLPLDTNLITPNNEQPHQLADLGRPGTDIRGVISESLLVGQASDGFLPFAQVNSGDPLTLSLAVPVFTASATAFSKFSTRTDKETLHVSFDGRPAVSIIQRDGQLQSHFHNDRPESSLASLAECSLLVRSTPKSTPQVYLFGTPQMVMVSTPVPHIDLSLPPFQKTGAEDYTKSQLLWGAWSFQQDHNAPRILTRFPERIALFSVVRLPVVVPPPQESAPYWTSEVWQDEMGAKTDLALCERTRLTVRACNFEKVADAENWNRKQRPQAYFEVNTDFDLSDRSWKRFSPRLKDEFGAALEQCEKFKNSVVRELGDFDMKATAAGQEKDEKKKQEAIAEVTKQRKSYIESIRSEIVRHEAMRCLGKAAELTSNFVECHTLTWQVWTELKEIGTSNAPIAVNLGNGLMSAKPHGDEAGASTAAGAAK